MGELLGFHNAGSILICLFAKGLHRLPVEVKLSIESRRFHEEDVVLAIPLGFNRSRQMGRGIGEGALEFEGLFYTFVIRQLVERVSIELRADASDNAWIEVFQSFEIGGRVLQILMSCHQQLTGEIGHGSQRIIELKGLFVITEFGVAPQAVVLLKGNSYRDCQCDQRADGLYPTGRAGMLLEPNNKPFHSAPLQLLNRIAMVHDLKGDANV
ncbi:hypothetical protein [Stutzerimonas nitrititolerans]|uniref:hypothetical protein n=1 Tax=Stutzerimonas nitrititolerans TaxID=2482751 RepID=UPI0028B07F00|nr:hypothetical protein [Stutzerimonas nitrititolerans]